MVRNGPKIFNSIIFRDLLNFWTMFVCSWSATCLRKKLKKSSRTKFHFLKTPKMSSLVSCKPAKILFFGNLQQVWRAQVSNGMQEIKIGFSNVIYCCLQQSIQEYIVVQKYVGSLSHGNK